MPSFNPTLLLLPCRAHAAHARAFSRTGLTQRDSAGAECTGNARGSGVTSMCDWGEMGARL